MLTTYISHMSKRANFIDHLAGVPLFAALSRKELGLIAKRGEDVEVTAGKVLCSEGEMGHQYFVIVSGSARVSRKGRKIAEIGPGQGFGELSLLARAPRNATVTAETDMEVVVLGQREFAGLIDDVPGFARKLLSALASRVREADAKSVQ